VSCRSNYFFETYLQEDESLAIILLTDLLVKVDQFTVRVLHKIGHEWTLFMGILERNVSQLPSREESKQNGGQDDGGRRRR
jgi:hypothetical protein